MSSAAPRVAVVAHSGKHLGAGLPALRESLRCHGVLDPLWLEIAKGRQAARCARQALDHEADVVFVWGGDGTVQRCVNVLAGTGVPLAICPAGTANLLARNLGLPTEIDDIVTAGLTGERLLIDTATMNGEHFAVMAGAGLDALMIDQADAGLKDRFGRVAYLWTGARNLTASPVKATVTLEGRLFFRGDVTCVLFGNVSDIGAGVQVFAGARPDDGIIEFGVVSARTRLAWARTFARTALGRAERSPFVTIGRGRSVRVDFDRPVLYEVDGGSRKKTRRLKVKVRPGSTVVCTHRPATG